MTDLTELWKMRAAVTDKIIRLNPSYCDINKALEMYNKESDRLEKLILEIIKLEQSNDK